MAVSKSNDEVSRCEPPTSSPLKFHAAGTAFSASFNRPVAYEIPTQAVVYLPTIGGHGHSRVEKFEVPRLVRFDLADSHVSGSFPEPNIATAEVTASISALNILNVITANRITSRLTSERKINEEAHIMALGSDFENLRIAGYEFKIKLRHEIFMNNQTHAELMKNVASPMGNVKDPGQDKVKLARWSKKSLPTSRVCRATTKRSTS